MLTSPKKGETAVHCYDPTLSVLVMLVSRNVFHVVSVLQSVVCLHTFLGADQISCRSYVGKVYRMRSLAVSGFSFIIWSMAATLRDSVVVVVVVVAAAVVRTRPRAIPLAMITMS